MVISGGNYKPDSLKPREVVSLLIDDDEMEKKCEYILFFQDCLIYIHLPMSVIWCSLIVKMLGCYQSVEIIEGEKEE